MLLVLAGVALAVAAARLLRIRLRERSEESRELPQLVFPARAMHARPAPAHEAEPAAGEEVTFNSSAPPVRIVREEPVARAGEAAAAEVASANGRPDAIAEVDADATLALLPGRLEPVNAEMHQEIRFVRVQGVKRFTLGRNPGPAHTHIQLRAATASRMHACMLFDEGRWRIGNMSQTNSVIVNGSPLNGDAARLLADGDRIEFGELTFVFRER